MVTGGTGAATLHGSAETSNSVMALVPLHPSLTRVQYSSRPTPNGETTPMPVMATRDAAGSHGPSYNTRIMPHRRSSPSLPALLYAWLGGAVFVTSLFYFGYVYGVRLGRSSGPPQPQMSQQPSRGISRSLPRLPCITACSHARAQSAGSRAGSTPSLERSTYVWLASLLFAAVCWFWQPVGLPALYRVTGSTVWILRAVQVAGIALLAHASFLVDWLDLAGIRQAQGASRPPSLVAAGPYRLVRHPIYLGWTLVVLGTSHMTADRLLFAAVSLFYLAAAVPVEERSLLATFGQAYEAYKTQVKWRIVPFVY